MDWPHRVLKLFRRTIAPRGMEARPVIVLLDEDLDVRAQVPESRYRFASISSRFSVFRKLSQLAVSYGFAGRLMLGIIWCR
jgi:hypothetical protein